MGVGKGGQGRGFDTAASQTFSDVLHHLDLGGKGWAMGWGGVQQPLSATQLDSLTCDA